MALMSRVRSFGGGEPAKMAFMIRVSRNVGKRGGLAGEG